MKIILQVFLVLSLICQACSETKQPLEKIDSEQITMHHAKGLLIEETEDGYIVEVRNPVDTSDIQGHYFLSRTAKENSGDTIAIPVNKSALSSTTFIAYYDNLDALDGVVGVTYADRIQNKNMKNLIATGRVSDLISGGELDFEKVINVNPDIFMAYSNGESDFTLIEEQGIPVVLNLEYLESTPLARAEWIKLVGCLTERFEEADSIFQNIEESYTDLKTKVALSSSLPSVFTGSRYKELWYAPKSQSYVATYIRDAGAQYVFDDLTGHGSAELDFEVALKAISDADYWGMVLSEEDGYTYNDVLNDDEIYASFKAYQEGNIFACNAAEDDYFGDAVMEPHLILADLIAIFHPNYLPNHSFSYFKPLDKP